MGTNSNRIRLLPFAKEIVRKKARSMIGQAGFTYSDVEDIEQYLMLEVFLKADKYDPLLGSESQLVAIIVRNAANSLLSQKLTEKRGRDIAFVYLNKEIGLPNGKTISGYDMVDKEAYLRSTRGLFGDLGNRLGLRIDMDRTLQTLHPDQCELATRLMVSTPSEIARDTGIPRTTLNDLISKLRSRLAINGLGEYLNFCPSDFKRNR